MKRLLLILSALILFGLGIYGLQSAVDYRQKATTTTTTSQLLAAKLSMQTKIVSKEYQQTKKNLTFDDSGIYQGEFPFEKLKANQTYLFTITLVTDTDQQLVNKEGTILSVTEELKLDRSEGKIVFELFGNQALNEQIRELDGFQAKGILKEQKTKEN
ncbi:hypothetical protein IGK74_000161 [Enterococcus sp. AZ150]|uniref:hypothetical protein n=1 Tax=Enterococcus sp. AZ150 TaxID=2774866 RepID=UPI003F29EC17